MPAARAAAKPRHHRGRARLSARSGARLRIYGGRALADDYEIDELEAYAGLHHIMRRAAVVAGARAVAVLFELATCCGDGAASARNLPRCKPSGPPKARFRVIFEQAPLGGGLMDSRSGRIMETNLRFAKSSAAPRPSWSSSTQQVTHPDDIRGGADNIAAQVRPDFPLPPGQALPAPRRLGGVGQRNLRAGAGRGRRGAALPVHRRGHHRARSGSRSACRSARCATACWRTTPST